MSKRFTDTDKWEDSWFRNLLPEYQRFWIFLTDKCDNAGVWEVDFEVAEFFLKMSLNPKEIESVFKDRIHAFDHGKKWFIPRFISFQYGTLDRACRPHNSILNLLESYGLIHRLSTEIKGINTLKDKTRQEQDNTGQDKKSKSIHFEGCKCSKCK